MMRAAVVLALVGGAGAAWALDTTFAGYGWLDHREFIGSSSGQVATPRSLGIDGTTLELAQKMVVDVSKGVNVNVKVCFGCHGIELAQGYAEWEWTDLANFRLGRFSVPVGEFNSRADPSLDAAPSKPLPYAMGDMLFYQQNAFNLGVVPAPYVDNGLEVFGGVPLGKAQLDYTAYLVKGFAGNNDLDFVASRQYIDDNHTPAVGTRVVLSAGKFSVGGSAGGGYYDPKDRLRYAYFGGELYGRVGPVTFRGELIERLTDFDPTVPGYLYVPKEKYFIKLGWYAQLDFAVRDWLTLVYRSDGLHRMGMPLPGSDITEQNAGIFRQTAGVVVRARQGFALKAGYEYWLLYGTPFENQHVVRAGLLYSY